VHVFETRSGQPRTDAAVALKFDAPWAGTTIQPARQSRFRSS
jgi:hypothetical protein